MAESWRGLHVLAVSQFDEVMLRVLFEAASALKAMVKAKGKCDLLRGKSRGRRSNMVARPSGSLFVVTKPGGL